MPEHVIELEDGEPMNVESRYGTRVATFTLQAVSPANTVAPFVRIGKPNGGTYLNAPLVEDPVRAAVLKERLRIKALADLHLPSAFGSKATLLAAIDAPAEEVSEATKQRERFNAVFRRGHMEGAQLMRDDCAAECRGVKESCGPDAEPQRSCYEFAATRIEALPLPEPPQ